MKTEIEKKPALLENLVITEKPELAKILSGRTLFPEKNKLAEEQIRKYGLPKELLRRTE